MRGAFTHSLGRYVFGLDNGLECDIDAQQAAYFGRLGAALPEGAKVIIVTHDPNWVRRRAPPKPNEV